VMSPAEQGQARERAFRRAVAIARSERSATPIPQVCTGHVPAACLGIVPTLADLRPHGLALAETLGALEDRAERAERGEYEPVGTAATRAMVLRGAHELLAGNGQAVDERRRATRVHCAHLQGHAYLARFVALLDAGTTALLCVTAPAPEPAHSGFPRLEALMALGAAVRSIRRQLAAADGLAPGTTP
jgi:hypothetical protein